MPKKLEKVNDSWVDRNNKNEKYQGHIEKDLEIGDKWLEMKSGKKIEFTVQSKEVLDSGIIYVSSTGREV